MARTHLIRKNRDEYYTSTKAVDFLFQFLPSPGVINGCIWDPSPGPSGGKNNIAMLLTKAGYNVVCTYGDFLTRTEVPVGCKLILSNPPYSLKSQFIEKCMFEFGIPWLFLLPLNTLASEIRCGWFRNHSVQLWVIPEKLSFKSPYHAKTRECSFSTCWFGWRITSDRSTLTFLKPSVTTWGKSNHEQISVEECKEGDTSSKIGLCLTSQTIQTS